VSRDPDLYVMDMLRTCERLLSHARGIAPAQWFQEPKTRDALLWNLLVLGEAAKNVPDEFRLQYPNVQWRKIAGLRDVLAHGYFGWDKAILQDVIENKIPELLDALRVSAK
jgi:uncharacterized protein with HEPN domain